MKKMSKLLALLIAVLMVASIQLPAMAVKIGDKAANIPSLKNLEQSAPDAAGTQTSGVNASQFIAENDKYIFVVVGTQSVKFRHSSALQIFDKNDGKLIKTVTMAAENNYYCPVRDMYVKDDVLFVAWGNAIREDGTQAQRATGLSGSNSLLVAYDVANVTSDALKQVVVDRNNAYTSAAGPYTWGGIAYFGEDVTNKNGERLYGSKVLTSGALIKKRYYNTLTLDAIKSTLQNRTAGDMTDPMNSQERLINSDAASVNTAQFMFKDGFFFEVLQKNGGLENYTGAELQPMTTNNQVRVYDLRENVTLGPSGSEFDIAPRLRGTFTTSATGDTAIKDIEVVGDYMYVATTAGIEVVSLAPAKSASENITLTAIATVSENGIGGVASLDAIEGYLFAGYAGPQYLGALGANSGAGALVAYSIKNPAAPTKVDEESVSYGALEISVNEKENIVYVLNDVYAPPAMTAFSYTPAPAVEEEFEFTAIKLGTNTTLTAGTFDISVELSNPAPAATGTLICAVYEGSKLADVFVEPDFSGNGAVTMVTGYNVTANVTEIKAMFLDSLTGKLMPLIPAISISK